MKIKDFKINRTNLKRLACGLVASTVMTMSLTGCGTKNESSKNNPILAGTILEDAVVIELTDRKEIAIHTGKDCGEGHKTYESILTGSKFISSECSNGHYVWPQAQSEFLPIKDVSLISSYLTAEEIEKGLNDRLTQKDIANIIFRITNNQTLETDNSLSMK